MNLECTVMETIDVLGWTLSDVAIADAIRARVELTEEDGGR